MVFPNHLGVQSAPTIGVSVALGQYLTQFMLDALITK